MANQFQKRFARKAAEVEASEREVARRAREERAAAKANRSKMTVEERRTSLRGGMREGQGPAREARASLERAVKRSGTKADLEGMRKAAKVPSAPAEGLNSTGKMLKNIKKGAGLPQGAGKVLNAAKRGFSRFSGLANTLPIPREEYERGMKKARHRIAPHEGRTKSRGKA